ncbi:putative lipoprotein [Candidatus Blochmanniella vafra str. BVAF]|uniref:Outer membrane protein assembly factor BamD n=1 Tax=Blochmanniella vafra (strain BVAF) TaxID=859654 RepID=E8Q5T9_BLOVB|nr:outer membrane protein assembly factor BamD [Candidatus Blochmannia vafer]ADV33586.1 putative lipoprotein [Candidatus Blochmannia vafer str. BVAF]
MMKINNKNNQKIKFIKPYILLSSILIINIFSTSFLMAKSHHKIKHQNSSDLYKSAHDKLLHNNYTESIQKLLRLNNLHPFEPYPQQIYLDLIYAYYKLHDFQSANNFIQRFLSSYPNHKNLDYVLYMQGLINMNLDKNNSYFAHKYWHKSWFKHNPSYANIAFHSFSKIIQNHPNSQYYIDAYKRLIILKNRIANYELAIIKFYDQRNSYISVILRSERMLRYFPNTPATYEALYYMKRAYQKVSLLDQSNIVNKIISENK